MMAIETTKDDYRVVEELLRARLVDPNIAGLGPMRGVTALMAASERGYLEKVRFLLERPDIDSRACNPRGLAAIDLAASRLVAIAFSHGAVDHREVELTHAVVGEASCEAGTGSDGGSAKSVLSLGSSGGSSGGSSVPKVMSDRQFAKRMLMLLEGTSATADRRMKLWQVVQRVNRDEWRIRDASAPFPPSHVSIRHGGSNHHKGHALSLIHI